LTVRPYPVSPFFICLVFSLALLGKGQRLMLAGKLGNNPVESL
jgi:hypothetical protein